MALATACLAAAPAAAFELDRPVACTPGQDCFVQHVLDRDPGPGVRDLFCGSLSYDGHEGVDIGLPSLDAMAAGVDVLAARAGTVRAVRDGMPDRRAEGPGDPAIQGRECGNGLVIDHGGGWTSQYCHMKEGSLAVRPGDRVEAGARLGQIGLSGLTEFPHLHFMVRKDDRVIDPFDGAPIAAPCSTDAPPGGLWSPAAGMVVTPGGALASGMLDRIPEYEEVWQSAPHRDRMDPSAAAIVFWAHFYGLRSGDVLVSRLTGPDGATLTEERHVMERNRATQFRALGRRRPAEGWPAGLYRGETALERDGAVIAVAQAEVAVP
jgi:hypothetical protein